MKVITVWNQKGGVGKTTLAVNLAAYFKEIFDYKVLLIDTDVQCNASQNYKADYTKSKTLKDVILKDNCDDINTVIQHTDIGDIIASSSDLDEAEAEYSTKPAKMMRLKKELSKLTGYDLVIIDTNPSINKLLYSALIASDGLLVPVMAEKFAIQGLPIVKNVYDDMIETFNPDLKLLGIVINKVPGGRSKLKEVGIDAITKYAKDNGIKVFETKLRDLKYIKESQAYSTSVLEYKPYCDSSFEFRRLVKEIEL